MDFTFFYTKKQLNGFLNSRFAGTVLCPEKDRVPIIDNEEKEECVTLSTQLDGILDEIAVTKKLIDPVIHNYITSIKDSSVSELLKYNNKTWSWREKSFLMRVSALASDREFSNPLIKAACAIELLGMSFCLIDDIIDESTIYDLKQTAWTKYGYKEVICASAILEALATRTLIDACHEAKISSDCFKKIMQIFQQIKTDAYISQFWDVESEKKLDFSEERYFEMISKFPGTFYAGLIEIACLISDINSIQSTKLIEFGKFLAITNQVRDDLIDVIGEEKVIGKKVGTDIALGKKRLPYIIYLNSKYPEKAREIPKNKMDTKYAEKVIFEMKSNGVINSCKQKIKEITEKAIVKYNSKNKNKWSSLLEELLVSVSQFS